MPGEDLHLSDQVHFQTHECGGIDTAFAFTQKPAVRLSRHGLKLGPAESVLQ